MNEYNEEFDTLHKCNDYVVSVCTIEDPILHEHLLVYGVYNTVTKVRESETRRLTNAISICNTLGNAADDIDADNFMQLPLALNTH